MIGWPVLTDDNVLRHDARVKAPFCLTDTFEGTAICSQFVCVPKLRLAPPFESFLFDRAGRCFPATTTLNVSCTSVGRGKTRQSARRRYRQTRPSEVCQWQAVTVHRAKLLLVRQEKKYCSQILGNWVKDKGIISARVVPLLASIPHAAEYSKHPEYQDRKAWDWSASGEHGRRARNRITGREKQCSFSDAEGGSGAKKSWNN